MVAIKKDFWPKSIAHLSQPYLGKADEEVIIAEISTELINGYPGYRHVYTALVPPEELKVVLNNPGGIGHEVEAYGPRPGISKEECFNSSFWIAGVDRDTHYEPLVERWLELNKTVMLPNNGLLMCYGLIPRYLKNGTVCWDDLRKPVFDVIKAKSLSEYKLPDIHTPASIIIKRDYLEDYLRLKGKAAVAVYYEHRYSVDDDDFDQVLGDKGGIEFKLPGRLLILKRVNSRIHHGTTQLAKIWGCRLIIVPKRLPISKEEEPTLKWPDFKDAISPEGARTLSVSQEDVYIKDEVLLNYEGKADYDILPEFGIVGYSGYWTTSDSYRFGRHHIEVNLRKLYEGTPPDVIHHFYKYSVSKVIADRDKKKYGDRNIGKRAKEVIYAYLDLVETLTLLANQLDLNFSQENIGSITTQTVDYHGWWRMEALKSLGYVIPIELTEEEFLNRCLRLYKLLEHLKPGPLKQILRKMNIPDSIINELGSLKLLGTICQLAGIAKDNIYNLVDDIENVQNLWNRHIIVKKYLPFFALYILRTLKGHKKGSKYEQSMKGALETFGIDKTATITGWGLALDTVYDVLIDSLNATTQIINETIRE